MDENNGRSSLSRRRFGQLSAGAIAAGWIGSRSKGAPAPRAVRPAAISTAGGGPGYNILFVFADQERDFPRWPKGMSLPAHERLQASGIRFHRHYTSAVMCTSSRSVMVTGLQTPDTRMFDNCDTPWVKDLSTDIPTVGHMLQKAGYHAAYKGKWHLSREFDSRSAERLFTREMEAYGFLDYASPGDVVGHTQGGYQFDHLIAGSAITWLRRHGIRLAEQKQPWALFVSLVNPHDVMYFNADAPDEHRQDTGRLLSHAARAPRNAIYRATWDDYPIPTTLDQPLDQPGRPRAHGEFARAWDHVLGSIPPDPARWRRFTDYYLNCIRAVDQQLMRILDELDQLGMAERTIIVYTADHGEQGGAHGLRGKGPFAYEESVRLPMFIVHPEVRGGQSCRALSSHIDLVPTLLAMAGVPAGKVGELAGRELPGRSLTPLFANPGSADVHALRDAALFTYSGLGTVDSDLIALLADCRASGKDLKETMKASGFRPNMKKRGSLRTVIDGRHKLTRYFSPLERNRPGTIDELYAANDVELYDLEADPGEMDNLAADKETNRELLLTMSAKLEAVIRSEIGVDDGREMPSEQGVSWTLEGMD